MSHSELKQTWKLANEQFLAQQMKLVSELDVAKRLLTPQQLEQLSKEMRKYRADLPVQTMPGQSQQTPGDKVTTSSQQQQRQKHVDSSGGKGGGAGDGLLVNFDSPATKSQSTPVSTKDTLLTKSKQRTPQMEKKSEVFEINNFNEFLSQSHLNSRNLNSRSYKCLCAPKSSALIQSIKDCRIGCAL